MMSSTTAPPTTRATQVAEGGQDDPPPPEGLTRKDVFSALGTLGAVTAIVTAVMFYFGWRRSDVQARLMGMDVSLFGYSSQDYVLRSITSLYTPILVIFGLLLAWLWLHRQIVARVERYEDDDVPEDRRRELAAVAAWGAAVGIVAAVGAVVFSILAGRADPIWPIEPIRDALVDDQWVVPALLIAGALLASYCVWIRRRLTPDHGPPLELWQRVLPAVLVAGTVLLGTFWVLEEYASEVGRARARQVIEGVATLPRAELTSSAPLGIDAPGVEETPVDVPGEADRYRTTGLRLLARASGKIILLHDGWNPTTGSVIVLPDSDDFSWQFSR
jgi:hypothetical protein